jgi:hypothetical protein
MTRPAKRLFLAALAVILMVVLVVDRKRVHEAEQIRTDDQLMSFAQRYLSPNDRIGVRKNHGATTNIIQIPYIMPWLAREYRWCKEFRETEFTFESEVVFRWPWET